MELDALLEFTNPLDKKVINDADPDIILAELNSSEKKAGIKSKIRPSSVKTQERFSKLSFDPLMVNESREVQILDKIFDDLEKQ